MKKILKYSLIVCGLSMLLLPLTSCDDFFTKTPPDKSDEDGYWKSERDVKSWIAGTYNGTQTALMNKIQVWGDGRTDNLFPTVYGGETYQLNTITASDSRTNWSDLYTVISRCNIAIEKVNAMTGLSEAAKNTYLGQFHGLRALMYFYIVRLWGPAPLLTKKWDGDINTKYNPRSPVEDIVKVIETDINEAVRMLDNEGVFYFNRGAALTLKMDFLAWRGRYDEIPLVYATLENLGYPSKRYSLAPTVRDWNKIFSDPKSSTESIFSLHWDPVASGNNKSPYAATIGNGGSNSSFVVSKEMWALMVRDTMDIRMWGVLQIPGDGLTRPLDLANAPGYVVGSNLNIQSIKKYWPLGGERGSFIISTTDWSFKPSIYRLADAMLLYAEALNQLDDPGGALEIVNQIRASRGCSLVASIEDYDLKLGNKYNSREKLIMDERQLEFFEEGKRWFDLLRVDWGIEVLDTHLRFLQYAKGVDITGFTNKDYLLWPVATKVLTSNPKLTQNRGY